MSFTSNFEDGLLVLAFCKNKFRNTKEISEFFGFSLRKSQRIVTGLTSFGYLEYKGNQNNRIYATTRKAIGSLNNGI